MLKCPVIVILLLGSLTSIAFCETICYRLDEKGTLWISNCATSPPSWKCSFIPDGQGTSIQGLANKLLDLALENINRYLDNPKKYPFSHLESNLGIINALLGVDPQIGGPPKKEWVITPPENINRTVLINGVPAIPVAGGVIEPSSGAFLVEVAGGYINTRSGSFYPSFK